MSYVCRRYAPRINLAKKNSVQFGCGVANLCRTRGFSERRWEPSGDIIQ